MHYLMNCNWRPYLINESDNDNNNKQSKQMTKQTEYLGRPQRREIQKMELKIYTYIYIYICYVVRTWTWTRGYGNF